LPASAVVGGWLWLALFAGWIWAPATSLAGVAFAGAAWRASRRWPQRVTALLGLIGGLVGTAILIAAVAIMMRH